MKTAKRKENAAISAIRQRLRDMLSGSAGYDTDAYIKDGDAIAMRCSPSTFERFAVVVSSIGCKPADWQNASLNSLSALCAGGRKSCPAN